VRGGMWKWEIVMKKKMKPIIFSTPMVEAILEGRKTMTRRIFKTVQKKCVGYRNSVAGLHDETREPLSEKEFYEVYSPIHKGDILWVRETWMNALIVDENVPYGEFARKGFDYKATHLSPSIFKWKPSIFMPREAARIFLEVISVRVERLQVISSADCFNEGIDEEGEDYAMAEHYQLGGSPIQGGSPERFAFIGLWDSINAKRGYSWESNPWVWAIEFKRIDSQAVEG
jgi:hypothetical protein